MNSVTAPSVLRDFAETTAVEHSQAQDNGGPGPSLALRRAVADKLVYARLRAALGGDCWWAISGGGALSKYETTVLLTVEETMDAMERARDIRYRPPGT